jgi:precorrin-3B methylase
MAIEANYDIYIVGLGIVNIDQITREAEACIKKSKQVFYIEKGIGIDEFLTQLCPNVTNLSTEYVINGDRLKTYHTMAAKVLEAALNNPPVTFALYGHPTIFAYPPFLVYEAAKELDLKVKVMPGISAMDCIFSELMIDPATNGIQMFEATDLLIRQRPLQTDVPVLLWQIGAVETALYSRSVSKPKRFERIKNYLLKFYPGEHLVQSIYCSNYPLMASTILKFKIADIENYSKQLHAGHTLYIPALAERQVMDLQLANDISDVNYLSTITETL